MFLTHLNVYLGKQERGNGGMGKGGMGEWGKGERGGYLNVYLGKQERGERGERGNGGKGEQGKGGMGERGKGERDLVPNQNRELAVSIQANIQSCCLLKNTCTKCILSPPPSVYSR